jgi:cyclopropane-fatty-acyl-phospholipid synthase
MAARGGARRASVAHTLEPLLRSLVPDVSVAIRFWDGSVTGSAPSAATILVKSPDALRRLLWAPGELGLGRAYVAGEIDVEGDLFDVLAMGGRPSGRGPGPAVALGAGGWMRALVAARRLGVLGLPPPPPPVESRLHGRRHSRGRDRAAIAHHYDISNDFYRLVLGETMTYSCAYFTSPSTSLDQAQEHKYELVCRKLGLSPEMRLLDVGCGWGAMVAHAAARHGVRAVGVTLSEAQAELAAKRVADADLGDRVEIRLCDYRDVDDGPYDAVCSIGMFEHVGLARLEEYFARLFHLLGPTGRLLNHGISRPGRSGGFSRRSFIDRYVFPDGELHEVGSVVSTMQRVGFEVRDVESLREHYARTLRCWISNLDAGWDEAERLVGPARARVWKLYMAASALNFDAGRTSIHQILGVKPDPNGTSAMPATRGSWVFGEPRRGEP